MPSVDEISKGVRCDRFEVLVNNFNGIHACLGIENAIHITGDCIAQDLESSGRNGLLAVVEENLKRQRSAGHDGCASLVNYCSLRIAEYGAWIC